MITVNGEKVEYKKNMTVAALLKRLDFIFPMIIVRINNKPVDHAKYDRTPIADRDRVDRLFTLKTNAQFGSHQ